MQVYLDVMQIIVLEIGKRPKMECYPRTIMILLSEREASRCLRCVSFEEISSPFCDFCIKFLIEFIQCTENISNFVFVIIVGVFVSSCLSNLNLRNDLMIIYFFNFLNPN